MLAEREVELESGARWRLPSQLQWPGLVAGGALLVARYSAAFESSEGELS